MIQITAQVSGQQIGDDLADDMEEAAGALLAFAKRLHDEDDREELKDFLDTEVRCLKEGDRETYRDRLHALGKLLIGV